MLTALEQEVNMVNHDGNEGDYTRLNLQALMRVLWEEIVGKIVSDLNRLLCSQESKLDGDK